MSSLSAGEIGVLVQGEVRGDEKRTVQGVAPLESATPEVLSFVASARYLPYLQATRAGVVLVASEWVDEVPAASVAVVVKDPHQALYTILTRLYPARKPGGEGVHPTAVVAADAELDPTVSIGAYAVVGEGVRIGRGTSIGAHVVIGSASRIGEDVVIHPHVTLYDNVVLGDRVVVHSGARLGKDGFGFVHRDGGFVKIPQVGRCVLEDDVEVGANTTIDRGSVGDTVIAQGTKIDNLVQLGHNVRLGRQVMVVSQVGISGSTVVGDGSQLGGQAGISGHLSIGSRVRVGAQAGVISDIPDGQTYSGYPARPHREALRAQASAFRLPELLKRLKKLEDAIVGRLKTED